MDYNKPSKVEDFKLTKEQKAWMKDYKKFVKLERALGMAALQKTTEAQRLRQLFNSMVMTRGELVKKAPSGKTDLFQQPEIDLHRADGRR